MQEEANHTPIHKLNPPPKPTLHKTRTHNKSGVNLEDLLESMNEMSERAETESFDRASESNASQSAKVKLHKVISQKYESKTRPIALPKLGTEKSMSSVSGDSQYRVNPEGEEADRSPLESGTPMRSNKLLGRFITQTAKYAGGNPTGTPDLGNRPVTTNSKQV